MMKKWMATGVLAAMLAFAWAACDSGGGDKENGGSGGNASGDDVTLKVTAAEGGTVATPSGDAKLEIPAGALPADTEITVKGLDTKGLPDESDVGSAAYQFGPDGLQFTAPVTLTLKLSGDVPDETKAVLAVLDGEKWTEIAGSTVAGGAVSGAINHFSTYVILFIEDKAVVTTLECEGYEFEACGGDPVGDWTVKDICLEGEIPGGNPFEQIPQCADQVYQMTFDFGGYINLKADKTYEVLMTPSASVHVELDDECLTAMGGGEAAPADMCTGLASNLPGCAYAAGKCTCDGPIDIDDEDGGPEVETGTWYTEGNTFYTQEDGSTDEPEAIPYCANGDEMAAQNTEVDEDDPSKNMTMTILLEK